MSDRIAPIILGLVPLVLLFYWNYLAWVRPSKFKDLVNYWMDSNERFKRVLGDFWWPLIVNERVLRISLLIGLAIALSVLVLLVLDPMHN